MDEGITPSLSFDDLSGLICISIQAKTHESPLKEGNHGHDSLRLGSWMPLWWIAWDWAIAAGQCCVPPEILQASSCFLLSFAWCGWGAVLFVCLPLHLLLLCLVWLQVNPFFPPHALSPFLVVIVVVLALAFNLDLGREQQPILHIDSSWLFLSLLCIALETLSSLFSHLCIIFLSTSPPIKICNLSFK